MSIVLVTGGAGNLGRQTVVKLARVGHGIRVLDLPELDDSFTDAHTNVNVFHGNICENLVWGRVTGENAAREKPWK